MHKKIILDSLVLIRNIVFNPSKIFKNIRRDNYDVAIFFLFFMSCLITLSKSFFEKQYYINFFSNQNINDILSFFNIPQIRWVLALLSFALFIFLIGKFSKCILKNFNKKELILCLLSISCVGILLQIIFFIFPYFLSQKFIILLRHIAFVWIVYLTLIAIKNSQNTTFTKAFMIFCISGLPAVFIIGLPGLAPYSLWLVL